jgi:hypothetical protein
MREHATRDRQREHNTNRKLYGAKLYGRARISNKYGLLPAVDRRSVYGRRFRDIVGLFVSDYGGVENCSAAEQALIQRASCLVVELERMENRFAQAEGATDNQLLLYGATAKTLNRLLMSLGLRRRPRDVSLDLNQYLVEQSQQPPIGGTPLDLDAPPAS